LKGDFSIVEKISELRQSAFDETSADVSRNLITTSPTGSKDDHREALNIVDEKSKPLQLILPALRVLLDENLSDGEPAAQACVYLSSQGVPRLAKTGQHPGFHPSEKKLHSNMSFYLKARVESYHVSAA
jgi:hypothetical protein